MGEDLRKWGSALLGSRVNSIIGHLNQSDLEGGKLNEAVIGREAAVTLQPGERRVWLLLWP